MKTYTIRPYEGQDYNLIIQFINDQIKSKDQQEDYQKRFHEEHDIYVAYENQSTVGFCILNHQLHEQRGHTLDIDIKTSHHVVTETLLPSFYSFILESINTHQSEFIVTSCEESQKKTISFWEEKGFSTWFILKTMVHDGRSLPKHNLSFRNYEDSDFDMYFRALGQAFEPMRRAMDITPFNVSQVSDEKRAKEREAFFKERENIFLFFERDSFVGTAIIDGREIDDVYVTEAFQGKGYGRKIMDVVMNLAMEKNDQPIQLTVVDWNVKAKKLYHSLGFHVIKTEVFLRKLIHH